MIIQKRRASSLFSPVAAALGNSRIALGLVLGHAAACYSPQPLDSRAVMDDVRQSDTQRAAGGSVAAPSTNADGKAALPPGALTEDRSVALALLWNRDLNAFRLSRGIAEGEIVTAGALSNPILRTDLTHIQKRDPALLGWDVRLSWTPPQPGVRAGRVGAARARREDVGFQVGEREWELACDVRAAHATIVALDEQIRVAQDTIGNRQRLAEAVDRRVQKGGTTRLDLDLVRLSLASSQHEESQRRLDRTMASSALIQLLGVGAPGGETLAVSGELPADAGEGTHPGQNALEDQAVAHRPALAAALARHRASEEIIRAETAARWPWISLSAVPRVRRNEFAGATTDLVFGVDVSLPFLDTNRGRIQSAQAARDVAKADVTTTVMTLRTDIARALGTIDAQREILRRLQAEMLPLLAQHDKVLTAAAQAAELDLLTVIASENLVLASRTELINARLDLKKAWIALDRAVGTHVAPFGAAR